MNSPFSAVVASNPLAPGIKENPGSTTLDPYLVSNNLTVVIEHPFSASARVQVNWAAASGTPAAGSHTTVPIPTGGVNRLEVPLPNSIVPYSFGQQVTVTYIVTDGTLPSETSLPLTFTVLPLAQSVLPLPTITQASNNGQGTVLDVVFLTHFTLRINGWPLITDGQYFWISLSGINADGSAFYIEYWIAPSSGVTQAFLQSGFHAETFSALPLKGLKGLKHGSTLTLNFRAALTKKLDKNAALRFAPRHYTINNDAQTRLSAPSIVEAKGSSQLDPLAARYTLTARLSFPAISGARIRVRWIGAPGTSAEGSVVTAYVDAGAIGTKDVSLPSSVVAFNLGRTVTVIFDLMVGNAPAVSSQPLILDVLPFAQSALPPPIITQASGNGHGTELDLTSITVFTLFIEGWALIAVGQYFWVSLIGTLADGGVFNVEYVIAPHPPVDQSFVTHDFFSKIFSTAPLNLLKDGSTLTVELRVALNKSLNKSSAVKFPAKQYTVKTLGQIPLDPKILAVKDPAGQDITDGETTNYTQVTISGSAIAGQQLEILDGQTVIGTIPAVSGTWELTVSALTGGPHVFTARPLNGSGGVSNSWTINVVVVREVTIKEAPDNANLNPVDAITHLIGVLNYASEPGDQVSVTWTAAPGTPAAGSHTTIPVPVGTMPMEIPLPVRLVAFSIGKAATISFTHARGSSVPVTSPPWSLNVLPIPKDSLVSPLIDEAKGTTELDLKDVTAGATLRFGIWPHIATGQRVSLRLIGRNANGAEYNLRPEWTDTRNAVHRAWVTSGGYSTIIQAADLLALMPGSTLSIKFSVCTDQVPGSAARTDFEVREYTIKDTR